MTRPTEADLPSQQQDVTERLQGFDAYMEKLLKDWNAPGVGVGIVAGDKLVFAKGYGYRDVERKLPVTPTTLFPIASNTKLFTAVAAGLLVEEGKLMWDEPIRDAVPALRFHNNELNNMVTLRDMLAHRTGISRHDSIWYQRDSFSRQELFSRIKYLEPEVALRQMFLYNNVMYAAVGYIIELVSGKTWEVFVRERIFEPLGMGTTVYTIADMLKQSDHGVPFTEKRDSQDLYKIPYYEETGPIAPAGAIISNIEELSHWLLALINDGKYDGKQVLPPSVLKATLEPAIAQPNILGETWGWWEELNPVYGMGRMMASYRGHLVTCHGGAIDGFHSQVSWLLQKKIGVNVFAIGDHCVQLPDIVTHYLYERLLELPYTPWSERWLQVRQKHKQAGKEARAKAGAERIPNTPPSHTLADYVGEYEHHAHGILTIDMKDSHLQFNLGKIQLPLTHFHYDRFDTPDDERLGKYSVNFLTNPQGNVNQATLSLDHGDVTFTRRAEILDPARLAQLVGAYVAPSGWTFQVVRKEDDFLYLVVPGQPEEKLIPSNGLVFGIQRFSHMTFEFVVDNGRVTALKQKDPSGEYVFVPR
ncbi:MAG: serine hydrolase [Nitrospira sp.]|nr:serine hydrolase [Nitrospira sp.]